MKRAHLILLALSAQMPAACSAAQEAQQPATEASRAGGKPVANLPHSNGRVFHSLDEYLAFLRKASAYDVPWYRRVGSNLYERAGRPYPGAPPPKRVTREELMRKFGFER
jgi:hypothetical protein